MTAAEIDLDTSTVQRTIRIDASRPLVWATLTSPEQIVQWFGQRADFPDGVHPGAEGTFGWTEHGDFPVRITAYEPTSRFAFTWSLTGEEIREDNATTATFTLTAEGGATVLSVVETGFAALAGDQIRRRAAMSENAQGWTGGLDSLAAYLTSLPEGRAAVADLDAGTIRRTILVAADQATTWGALVDPAAIDAWWGHPARFPDGVRPGSLGSFEWVGHGLFPVVIDELDEPRRFVLTWGALGETTPGPTATQVTFTLTGAGDRTLLTVLETGFENHEAAARRAAMEDNVDGWNTVLDSFARFAEVRP